MDADEIREELVFAAQEAALAERFGIPADALVPLLFSLRYGGDWSYAAEGLTAISAVKKTTVYDDERLVGYSLEEIYLFVDPVLLHREGTVYRLEKCGSAPARLLVKRPYRVGSALAGSLDRPPARTNNPDRRSRCRGDGILGLRCLRDRPRDGAPRREGDPRGGAQGLPVRVRELMQPGELDAIQHSRERAHP